MVTVMSSHIIGRFIHLHTPCFAAAVEKSLLATLRKKTGYTFSNCKKALEMHNNDLQQAEKWLKQQAQALGWSKATKLEGRATLQGLVGVAVHKNNAVLIEVNCETDFVARNREFQNMVATAAHTCLNYVQNEPTTTFLNKTSMETQQLKELVAGDGKSLADHLALMIGTIGENATLRRAFCMKTADDIRLAGYAHPSGNASDNGVALGKFGGLLAFRGPAELDEEVARGICQHVVGLNPRKIGGEDDIPAKEQDDETCLLHQDYLLDDSVSVKEILEENQLEVVDFKRFECGEKIDELDSGQQRPALEAIETCQ